MTIDWDHFAPATSLLGGAMIGLAATTLILFTGRIAGVSGIIGGGLLLPRSDTAWRLSFLAGLALAPWAAYAAYPALPRIDSSWGALILAGLIVGYGVRLANGCTSGHGVCGLSNRSPRSAVAVLTFMATGFLTVFLVRHGFRSWFF
jgi:uncharacterized membrane protein YedE/YeeE